jgi:signal transduction histidine kinase
MEFMTKLLPPHVEDRRRFISEAFHSFHQPLTVLHCGLELGLLRRRTEQEYRQRLDDALQTAGAILLLNNAVRELVDAIDPGEDLNRVELKPLLSRVVADLGYEAETGLVTVRMECPEQVFVAADAGKLARNLGNLATSLVRSANPRGYVQVEANRDATVVSIEVNLEGSRREAGEEDLQKKVEQIRLDAACSYSWAIGGEFKKTKKGFAIRLPALS